MKKDAIQAYKQW